MCGRFTVRSSGEVVAEAFGLPEAPDLVPRFNIAPGQPVAVVRQMHSCRASTVPLTCQPSSKGARSPVVVSNRAHLPAQTAWTTTR